MDIKHNVILLTVLCICSIRAMEMRETVERMVMVRRTGSDLQPAATGFIYRSDNNGPASVIKLGEGDINDHLDSLPTKIQRKAYSAPIPIVAALNNKQENEIKAASYAREYVIPVVEAIEGDVPVHEYKSGESEGFGDYIGNYRHFDDDHHHDEHGGGNDFDEEQEAAHGEKGEKDYKSSHEYKKGGAGSYASEKLHSYSISGSGGHKKEYNEADADGSDFAHGHAYDGEDHGHKSYNSKGEDIDGFHKLFNKDEFKKDKDFYDEEGLKGGFDKFDHGHVQHGSHAGRHEEGGSHASEHGHADFGKHGFHDHGADHVHHKDHSAEDAGESFHHEKAGFGSEGLYSEGGGYGYQLEH